MKKDFNKIYQFKITLEEVEPPVWRVIQVPENYSFWDLHVAIQDAMGWEDYHLHQFELAGGSLKAHGSIGIPDLDCPDVMDGRNEEIKDWFSMVKTVGYLYDFGDGWEHKIKLEKIIPKNSDAKYPICLEGKRSCPPEDCGGPSGYEEFLEIIKNPKHKEHKNMLEWIGGKFDPES
ncbi:MAG: hypothetical protein COS07_02145, partial [Candidatus Aenigmarchaeota archaeon CG01_land_8_20_14_3_00_37_9]